MAWAVDRQKGKAVWVLLSEKKNMERITEVLEKMLIFLSFSLHYAEQFRVLCSKNTQIA